MKQTAVEWLIDEIKFARNLCDDPSAEMDIWHTLDVLIAKGEEAKEMEKEQREAYKYTEFDIIRAFEYGWNQRHYGIMDEDELYRIQKTFIQSINEVKQQEQ